MHFFDHGKDNMSETKKMNHPNHCMVVFAPYPLGETRVQREAEVLVRNGYDVDVICLRIPGEPGVDTYKNVNIYRLKYRLPNFLTKRSGLSDKFFKYLRFFFAAGLKVTQLYFKKKYAVIQVHNLPDFLVFCSIIPKLLGASIILDLHDLMPEFYEGRFGQTDSFVAKLVRIQERWACRFADHVITVSEPWQQALIQRGVPEKKCSVVMNVADETIFHPSEQERTFTKINGSFRLIYHGTFVKRYGLDLAIQAVDKVRTEIPNIHLSLVGWGEFLPQMKEMISHLGLETYVEIDDLHLAEELPEIIQACDLGIVPYCNDIFTDGLVPTKLLEYAAMEIPAIAARTTAIQSYFADSNVEFFRPGDVQDLANCICRLYKDPDRLKELACRSKNFKCKYNWGQIGKDYVLLVNSMKN